MNRRLLIYRTVGNSRAVLYTLVLCLLSGCGGGSVSGGNGGGSDPGNNNGGNRNVTAYESFAYPAGIDLEMLGGGTGFSGAWVGPANGAGFTGFVNVAAGNLNAGGLTVAGNHVAVQGINFTPVSYTRTLAAELGTPGTTLWMSFVLRGAAPGNSGGILLGTLRTSDVNPPGALLIGDPTGQDNFGLEHTNGLSITGPTRVSSIPAAGQALLVVRITFREGEDTCDLFVNPAGGSTAPTVPDATLRFDLGQGPGSIDLMSWGKAGGDATYLVDELRFGESFAAVTPI